MNLRECISFAGYLVHPTEKIRATCSYCGVSLSFDTEVAIAGFERGGCLRVGIVHESDLQLPGARRLALASPSANLIDLRRAKAFASVETLCESFGSQDLEGSRPVTLLGDRCFSGDDSVRVVARMSDGEFSIDLLNSFAAVREGDRVLCMELRTDNVIIFDPLPPIASMVM